MKAKQGIIRTPVNSSNIKSMGHDKQSNTLEVEFHNKDVWQYQPVTEEAFNECMKAPSKGSWFSKNVKFNENISSVKAN